MGRYFKGETVTRWRGQSGCVTTFHKGPSLWVHKAKIKNRETFRLVTQYSEGVDKSSSVPGEKYVRQVSY